MKAELSSRGRVRQRAFALMTAVLGLIACQAVVMPGAAQAYSDGACPTRAGVTVVVDFQSLGGGVVTRCTDRGVSSGWDALVATGFNPQGTARFAGFVCRLSNLPSPADQDCQNTPPANAHWGYWYANPRGGNWTYSNLGAGNRVPPEGSVEGWSFSGGSNPRPGVSIGALPSDGSSPAKPVKPSHSAPSKSPATTPKPSRPSQQSSSAAPQSPSDQPSSPKASASQSGSAAAASGQPSVTPSATPSAIFTAAVDDQGGTAGWLNALWLLPIAGILSAAVILSRRRAHD